MCASLCGRYLSEWKHLFRFANRKHWFSLYLMEMLNAAQVLKVFGIFHQLIFFWKLLSAEVFYSALPYFSLLSVLRAKLRVHSTLYIQIPNEKYLMIFFVLFKACHVLRNVIFVVMFCFGKYWCYFKKRKGLILLALKGQVVQIKQCKNIFYW